MKLLPGERERPGTLPVRHHYLGDPVKRSNGQPKGGSLFKEKEEI
jgi:hypothetical protein